MKSDIQSGSWSYEEAFAITGHGWYNYQMLVTCSLISVASALDTFGFAITVASASCDLNLSINQIGLLAASPFFAILFAYPWGYFADTKGRRKALLLSMSGGFMFGVIGSFSINWQMMLVLKIIGCSFSSASFSLTMTYLGESTREKNRGQYLFIMMSMNLAAEIWSFGLAYIILPLTFVYPITWLSINFTSWRLYALVLSVPLGLGALLLLVLHESPKFLAHNGEDEKALQVLRKIFIVNGGKEEDFLIKSLHSSGHLDKDISFCDSLARRTLQLFKPPLLWRTLQLYYLISLTCFINNACVMWFPTMLDIVFKSLASDSDVSFCNSITEASVSQENTSNPCSETLSKEMIFSGILASLFFTILNLSIVKFAAWRRLLLISVLAIACFSCAMIVLLKQPIASAIFFTLAQITAIGTGSIASYFVDLYPTSCRSLAPSLGFMFGRFSSFTAVVVIGATIVNHCSKIFYTSAALAFSGVCVALLLP